eukprot:RCo007382
MALRNEERRGDSLGTPRLGPPSSFTEADRSEASPGGRESEGHMGRDPCRAYSGVWIRPSDVPRTEKEVEALHWLLVKEVREFVEENSGIGASREASIGLRFSELSTESRPVESCEAGAIVDLVRRRVKLVAQRSGEESDEEPGLRKGETVFRAIVREAAKFSAKIPSMPISSEGCWKGPGAPQGGKMGFELF